MDLIEIKQDGLEIRLGKTGNFIQGLTISEVKTFEEVNAILKKAMKNRSIVKTKIYLGQS